LDRTSHEELRRPYFFSCKCYSRLRGLVLST